MFEFVIRSNIERFQRMLETQPDKTERLAIEELLDKEKANLRALRPAHDPRSGASRNDQPRREV